MDLDGKNFDIIGFNFRNNYELTVDSFGTVWQSDNDDDGICRCVDGYGIDEGVWSDELLYTFLYLDPILNSLHQHPRPFLLLTHFLCTCHNLHTSVYR